MITRDQVVAEARGWLNTPWHHQAHLKGVGADCLGLIAGVDVNLGLPEGAKWLMDIRYKNYGRDPDPTKMSEGCKDYLIQIPFSAAGLGDVLQFDFRDLGVAHPMHYGIISNVDPLRIIHSHSRFPRKVIEHGVDNLWRARVTGAFRLPGVS